MQVVLLPSCQQVMLNTPKWNEAFGNVVVEAMACGVPVVAYSRGGPAESIKDGINGFLVPPDDITAMGEAVGKAKEVDRRGCRRWAEENASRAAFAERLERWLLVR